MSNELYATIDRLEKANAALISERSDMIKTHRDNLKRRDAAIWNEAADKIDAERWRAFIGCARIRLLGSAGLTDDLDPNGNPHGNYGHIGLEAWTIYDVPTDENAAYWLTRFADKSIAIRAMKDEGVGES